MAKVGVDDDAGNTVEEPETPAGSAPTHTLKEFMYYRVDAMIGTKKGQIIILMTGWAIFTIIFGAIYAEIVPGAATNGQVDENGGEIKLRKNFWECVWEAWTYMADPGTHAGVYDELGTRILALVITWFGIVFFATIIGFVVDAIQVKMDNLKKGKSDVVEADHTVMLGWTSFSVAFILEIADANSSEGGGTIVVLAERDKQELELEFRTLVKPRQLMGTKVVFRKGSPMHQTDLIKVSCHTARAILVLAGGPSDGNAEFFSPDKADATTLRTVLSLSGMECGLRGHIVAEILDIDNEPLVRMVGQEKVETLVSHDVIGRLMLMSARQPGLARVYTEILGFDGDEFYMETWPELDGVKFGELVERFPDATPIGLMREHRVLLNPSVEEVLLSGDELIVIAEDDDTYKPEEPAAMKVGKVPTFQLSAPAAETILMTGWRRDIRDIFMLLDTMVVAGTTVHVLAETPVDERKAELIDCGLDVTMLSHLTLVHHVGNSASRKRLEQLDMGKYTSVMILADEAAETDVMHSDSHALATLLLVRDIQTKLSLDTPTGMVKPSQSACICEILDSRTQKTIASNKTVAMSSDFVQSNEMISQILAMISENRAVKHILDELLGAEGSDLCVYESARYTEPQELVSYFTLAKRAQSFGEVLCGYQMVGDGTTIINPRDKATLKTWGDASLVILRRSEEQQKLMANIRSLMPQAAEKSRRRASVATFNASTEARFATLENKVDAMAANINRLVQVVAQQSSPTSSRRVRRDSQV